MNRSKGVALLLLTGAFATGGAGGYVIKGYLDKDRIVPNVSRNEPSLRRRAYDDLGLSPEVRTKMDSLLDLRNRLVNEAIAPGRQKADSIRSDMAKKQLALLTPDQLAKWQEQTRAWQERMQRQGPPRSSGGRSGRSGDTGRSGDGRGSDGKGPSGRGGSGQSGDGRGGAGGGGDKDNPK